MSCKTLAQDITQAITTTSLAGSDQFVFARNSQAYNITFSSFTAAIGTTGCIKPQGSPTSVSILNQPAQGYNYIRGIEPSQGITAAISPHGGVAIKTNFVNGTGGTGIIKDKTAEQIKFRSISAGDGIQVDLSDDGESIDISTTTATAASNTVIVETIADFPAPVGDVITLADDTQYFVATNISTALRFVFGASTVVTAADPFVTNLTYTGTGDMFTFTNGSAGFRNIAISCPNGTMVNTDSVTSGNLVIRFVRLTNIKNLGSLKSPSVGISNCFMSLHTGQGFTFGDSTDTRLSIQTFTVASTTDATSNFLDLGTGTFTAFSISNIAFLNTVSGQTFLTGLAGGANLNNSIIGFVSQVTINGDMAGLGTITNSDPGWDFSDNNKIGDTRPIALMSLDAPTTTVITTINTPVKVTGVFTDRESSLFTIASNGRVTYNGNRPFAVDLTASITFQSSSGTATFAFYVAKNGSAILASSVSREVTASTTANVSLIWDLTIVEGDYLEIFVANTTGTSDVSALNLIARIK